MYPEESVQAANDAGVKKATPVHWGGFSLAQHSWREPANRFVEAANQEGLSTVYPELGKVYTLTDNCERLWWQA